MRAVFNTESFFPVTARELFEFHERPDAFALLNPRSANVDILSTASTLAPSDDVVRFTVKFWFLKFMFEMIHTEYRPYKLFIDQQRQGLFSSWRHEHRFFEGGWDAHLASRLQDRIVFTHPLLPLFLPFVRGRLKALFQHRHQITGSAVSRNGRATDNPRQPRIAVTGATGLIGRRVIQVLRDQDAQVVAFVRDLNKARRLLGQGVELAHWDFTRPELKHWKQQLAAIDGVIHLAGTPLFDRRWTPAFKRAIEESRVLGTRQLVDAITESSTRPEAFITASALGIYGTNPALRVTEDSLPADDFLARICVNWEAEAKRLEDAGVRTVAVRIGIVLSTESGALKELLPLFRFGLGGPMGYPNHWINWIHLEDIARIFAMAVFNPRARGPINGTAPNPVTMRGFARAIGRTLRRPVLMRYPVPLVKLAIGEAGGYSSGGPRATADLVQELGYRFFFEEIEPALVNLLCR